MDKESIKKRVEAKKKKRESRVDIKIDAPDGEIHITSDESQFILKQKGSTTTYHATIEGLLGHLYQKRLRESSAKSIAELVDVARDIHLELERMRQNHAF